METRVHKEQTRQGLSRHAAVVEKFTADHRQADAIIAESGHSRSLQEVQPLLECVPYKEIGIAAQGAFKPWKQGMRGQSHLPGTANQFQPRNLHLPNQLIMILERLIV